MRSFIAASLPAFALLVSSTALAQTPPPEDPARLEEARSQYRAGVQAFQRGRYGEATIAFERSFHARPHPATLYNAAEARMRSGDQVGALDQLRELLAMTAPAPEAELVTRARALAEQMGEHALQAAVRETHACPACPACQAAPVCPPPLPSHRITTHTSPLAWALAGSALVLVGVGAGLFAVAIDNSSTYNNQDTPMALQTQLRDQGQLFRALGGVGLALGVGSAIGATLLFLNPRQHDEVSTASRVQFGVSASGVVVGGTF